MICICHNIGETNTVDAVDMLIIDITARRVSEG